jgi:hypothetical protein
MRWLRGQGASRAVLLIAIRARRLRVRRRRVLMGGIRLCMVDCLMRLAFGGLGYWGVHGFMDGIPLEWY